MTTFYQGDCLEVMKDLSDNSIDCFICDLPYGQLSSTEVNVKRGEGGFQAGGRAMSACAWDVKIDLKAFWEQVKRLAKDEHTPVLMFCNTRFGIELINSNPSWFRYDLVWDKQRGVSFLLANKMPMKSHEMIYVFSKSGAFYNRIDEDAPGKKKDTGNVNTAYCSNVYSSNTLHRTNGADEGKKCVFSVITMKKVGTYKQAHPTEKPEELYEWLLKRYVPKNGTVLDPTAGSFNSCFVADRLGLTAIGIEKDQGFFEKAAKRLNA